MNVLEQIDTKVRTVCLDICESGIRNPAMVCWALFSVFIFFGAEEAFALGTSGDPKTACDVLLKYIEGGFASLVAAAAGLGAIVAAAVGGFKAAWALVVISIGAFILRTWIGVFLVGCAGGS